MAKKVKLTTSKFALQKCGNKRHFDLKTGINTLPDDILIHILSSSTMKDAARASVLSHRWRYLWTFSTGNLEFDRSKMVKDMKSGEVAKSSLKHERRKFIKWVNQAMTSHKAPFLHGLKLCFDMDHRRCRKCFIDSWINFAIEKKVKSLELDFPASSGYLVRGNYALTPQLFNNSRFESLTSLRLNCIDITGKSLDNLITSQCPFLQILSVKNSRSLVDLKISSLSLKSLEIKQCPFMESMEISSPTLVSFKYCGQRLRNIHMNVPNLRVCSLGMTDANFLAQSFCELSSYIFKLELLDTLKFNISEQFKSFPRFPQLSNVKQLILVLDAWGCDKLLQSRSFLDACPLLHRLVIKLENLKGQVLKEEKVKGWKATCPHKCLKVIEIFGFVGSEIDVGLALYLIKNCVLLEKIIIDPNSAHTYKSGWDYNGSEKKLAAIAQAKQLQNALRPGIDMIVREVLLVDSIGSAKSI